MASVEEHEAKRERVLQLYAQGYSIAEIARELGMKYQTVYSILRLEGVLRKTKRVLTPEEEEEIVRLYREGVPVEEIARRFGVVRKTVYNVLTRKGVERDRLKRRKLLN